MAIGSYIGELLVGEGLVTQAQLANSLSVQGQQGGGIAEIMVCLGYVNADAVVRFVARQPDPDGTNLRDCGIPMETVAHVSEKLALEYSIFPVDQVGNLLTVGTASPLDSGTLRTIEESVGLTVRTVLYSAEDIHGIIEYGFGDKAGAEPDEAAMEQAETALKLRSVVSLLRRLDSLPALPETVQRVQEVLDDPASTPNDLADTIATDPALAAKVLSVANSSFYGFPNRVDSLYLAVALLGPREVHSILLSVAVVDALQGGKGFDYATFWHNSMSCGAVAKLVAKASGRERTPGVFAIGLLCDIGRVALFMVAPERYGKIPPDLEGAGLLAAEEKHVGVTHAEAGYQLATQWGLPSSIAEAIRFHHHPDFATEGKTVVSMAALADSLVRVGADAPKLFEGYDEALALLNLDSEAVASLRDGLHTDA